MASLSPFQQYQQKFPGSFPEGTARVVGTMGMWDEAEAMLTQAMELDQPVADWQDFLAELSKQRVDKEDAQMVTPTLPPSQNTSAQKLDEELIFAQKLADRRHNYRVPTNLRQSSENESSTLDQTTK